MSRGILLPAEEATRRRLEAALVGLRQQLLEERARRQALQESWSWRATRPLRAIGRSVHRLASTLGAARVTPSPPAATLSPDAAEESSVAALRAQIEREVDDFLASGERLTFAGAEQARVSILLVLFNQAALTLRCLRSIAATVTEPVDLILVDNGSTDVTDSLLQRIDGAAVVRPGENLHYLRGVNLGAARARAPYLLLLNNDAELAEGSLAAAVSVLDAEPRAGAVGARLVYPGGRLQEAGSIVWRDGSCFCYGRDDDPDAGPYMFQRDVDYVGGAFLLVRRHLFEELGRFDEAFAPAYYEETDFCLRLWEAGHRVVYDPRVLVRHHEFGSGLRQEAFELMRRHQAIFAARHRAKLERDHLPPLPENPLPARSRDWDRVRGRVLHVARKVPRAGTDRCAALVNALHAAGYFATFYPVEAAHEGWEEVRRSLPIGVEVMLGAGVAALPRFFRERAGYYDRVIVHEGVDPSCLRGDAPGAAMFLGRARLIHAGERSAAEILSLVERA